MFGKPIPSKKSTQSRHWQFDGFHFQIFILKDDKVLPFLISAGIEFQIAGPKYWIEPLPNLTELILGIQSFWSHLTLSHVMTHLTEIVLKNPESKDHLMLWTFL